MRTNKKKLKSLILYILGNYNNSELTITKLQKLLYHCDFGYYHKHNKSISGYTYTKNLYGPTIKDLPNIIKNLVDKGLIQVVEGQNYYGSPQTNFALIKIPGEIEKEFSDPERLVIDEVNQAYRGLSPSEISTLSQRDPPYVVAEEQEKINYDNVNYRDEGIGEEQQIDEGAQTFFEEAEFDKLFSALQ